MESYGEICVGCNCCGRIINSKEAIAKANLIVNIRHLKEVAEELCEENFDTMVANYEHIIQHKVLFKKHREKT